MINDFNTVFTAGSTNNAVHFQTFDDFGNQRTDTTANDPNADLDLIATVNDGIGGAAGTTMTYTYVSSGAYDAYLPVTSAGTYQLSVTAGGNAVQGSPFSITVAEKFGEQLFPVLSEMRILGKIKVSILDFVRYVEILMKFGAKLDLSFYGLVVRGIRVSGCEFGVRV